MEDVIQFSRNVHEAAHVAVVEGELWIAHQVLQILHIGSKVIVHR